jgi:hypothetical protein
MEKSAHLEATPNNDFNTEAQRTDRVHRGLLLLMQFLWPSVFSVPLC